MVKVLVTGAAGYLGSILSEHLLDAGHSVIGVDNLLHAQDGPLHLCHQPAFEFVRGDCRDEALMRRLVPQSDVLVPLALDESGWGTVAIAATFIGAGLVEVALGPVIGGISDRRGRLYPIRAALTLLAVVAVAFAIVTPAALIALLVVGASLAAAGIYSPGIALVSDRAEANEMPQTLAFGVMNMPLLKVPELS